MDISKKVQERPIVFVSYSWDTDEHKRWVLKLTCDLRTKYGIDVMLDSFIGKGQDLVDFMEKGIKRADKVLVIGTPLYKQKSEKTTGGVKYEQRIIKASIFGGKYANKFIPVLRAGEFGKSFPDVLMTRNGFDMSEDGLYESSLENLAREIWETPEIIQPALGPIPEFVTNDKGQIEKLENSSVSVKPIEEVIDIVKRTIASPQRKIEFSDIIENETKNFIGHLDKVFTTEPLIKDTWNEAWNTHILASKRLCTMSDIIIKWSKLEHQQIVIEEFQRIVNRKITFHSFMDGTVQLNYIAPLLLLYTMGIKCVYYKKYSLLHTLLSMQGKMWRNFNGDKTPIIEYLNLWLFDSNDVNRLEGTNKYTPASVKIKNTIKPYFENLIEEDYDVLFDIFEYIFNLYFFLLGKYPSVLPISYRWRSRLYLRQPNNMFDVWFNRIEKEKQLHPIFVAGMFNGEYEEYVKVKSLMDKGMRNVMYI